MLVASGKMSAKFFYYHCSKDCKGAEKKTTSRSLKKGKNKKELHLCCSLPTNFQTL